MSFGGHTNAHAYAATKAAINNLVQSLAVTHGRAGLRTNCVAPGLIDTEMAESVIATGLVDRDETRFLFCPLGRAATADEVASAALFLASSSASYINGAMLTVDGGTSAKV
jgi:NAD(P)-dependent dehydrogenase (short-subunit alcohol dehydrogenase family)